jgi:SAM-dependent methyltransferase
LTNLYPPSFYQSSTALVRTSARKCVPLILDLLRPGSVVDVGCGQGEWLAEVAAQGVNDILGVDGPHVREELLEIPRENFTRRDLAEPWRLDRRFDVVMTLEVAEHLPARSAPAFVRTLTSLGPAVVFSAAVPGQGGTNHVNEQWPWYWKALFAECGFVQLDPFRQVLWRDPEVAFYYQQNLFLYVDPAVHAAVIDRVGVPGPYTELTLVRTTILQELTGPGRVKRFLHRVGRKIAKVARRCGIGRPRNTPKSDL